MLSKHSTKENILSAFEKYGTKATLESCPALLHNKAFMLLALEIDGFALAFASPELRDDKELVVLAIKQTAGWAYFYASNRLRIDIEICELLWGINTTALIYTYRNPDCPEYDDNPEFIDKLIFNAIKQILPWLLKDPMVLEIAPFLIRNNKQIVLALVKINGLALQFASNRLQNSLKIVTVAVSQNAKALDFASEDLQNNLKLLNLAAANGNIGDWLYYGLKSAYLRLFKNDTQDKTKEAIDLSIYDAFDDLSHEILGRKKIFNSSLIEINNTLEKTILTQLEIDESLKKTVSTLNETDKENALLKESLTLISLQLETTAENLDEKDKELGHLIARLQETQLVLAQKETQLAEAIAALNLSKTNFDQQIKRFDELEDRIATLLIEKSEALDLAQQTQKTNQVLEEENRQNQCLINQSNLLIDKINTNLKFLTKENAKLKEDTIKLREDTTKLREHEKYLLEQIESLTTDREMLLQQFQATQNQTENNSPTKTENSPRFFS